MADYQIHPMLNRYLNEKSRIPRFLEGEEAEYGRKLGEARERVRQIEESGLYKLGKYMRKGLN